MLERPGLTKQGSPSFSRSPAKRWKMRSAATGTDCPLLATMVFSLNIFGWNVGGAALDDMPRIAREAALRDLPDDDLMLLQELPRSACGWCSKTFGSWKMIGHRGHEQWRGTGVFFNTRFWAAMRKLQASKGSRRQTLDRGNWYRKSLLL